MLIQLKKISISITFIFMMVMLFSCKNDINLIKAFEENENQSVASSFDVNMTITDSGFVTVILKSPQIDHYSGEKDYMEMLKGLELNFYNNTGIVTSHLTANYAINHIDEKRMEAKHNVVAVGEDNKTLYTEHLIWDQTKKIIYTDEKVKFVTEDETFLGTGFVSNEDFSEWEILETSGSFSIDDPDES